MKLNQRENVRTYLLNFISILLINIYFLKLLKKIIEQKTK